MTIGSLGLDPIRHESNSDLDEDTARSWNQIAKKRKLKGWLCCLIGCLGFLPACLCSHLYCYEAGVADGYRNMLNRRARS